MKFYSPYDHMIQSAQKIPDDANAKLFMRHSIRFDNPVNGDFAPLMLTPEGIQLAEKMGSAIDRPIGKCTSSKIKRCQQTITSIISGMPQNLRPQTADITELEALSNVIGNPMPPELGGVGWFEYFHYLQTGNTEASRGITLEQESASILNAIFAQNGTSGTLDLICSHDSHVVILASSLFDLKTGLEGHDWCQYAEGIFLYGSRENFTALWRGQQKTFTNYLL